jgi:hypothetical protein
MEQNTTQKTRMVNGAPTAPAVANIMEAFPDIQPDQVITHEELEAVIGFTRRSNRYITVVAAWKAALFADGNVLIASAPGIGYRRIDGTERVGYSGRKLKVGIRRIKHAGNVALSTPSEGLDVAGIRQRDHLGRVCSIIAHTHAREQRALRSGNPIAQLIAEKSAQKEA